MRWVHTVLLASGAGFLVYLIGRVGGAELWSQLTLLGWGVIPLIVSEGFVNLAHTAGWRHCLAPQSPRLPLLSLFRMALAGIAINYLTPTASLGGEVAKAGLLGSHRPGPEAVSSVLIDKFCLALAHLLFLIPGSLVVLCTVPLPSGLRIGLIVSTVVLSSGILLFMLLQKQGKVGWLIGQLAALPIGGRPIRKAAQQLSAVDEHLKAFYRQQPRALGFALGWHLFGHGLGILQTWLFFRLLHLPVPVSAIVGAGFLCLWFDLFTFVVPLNAGTLEGSRILALKAVGQTAAQGMSYGVALRLAQLFWAVCGLMSYGFFLAAMRRRGEGTCGRERASKQRGRSPSRLRALPSRDR